ncbi:hypothetical protein [Spirosoma gilvum]
MVKYIFFWFITSLMLAGYTVDLLAQSPVDRRVVAASGGSSTVGTGVNAIDISFTIGETVIGSFTANTTLITNGFQQLTEPKPTIADFSANPDPLCVGSQVTFTASLGNLTGSYSYTLTDGISSTTGTSSNPAFSQILTASESGIQTYSLIVSSNGQLATDTYDLTVSELPSPSLSASHEGVLTCSETSVTLTAGGGDDYKFSGPGILSQDPENGTAVVNLGGVYSVTVTNTEIGCFNTATTKVSSFTTGPEISLIASSTALTCTNPSVDLTVEGDGDALWSTGSTSSVISVTTAGTYSVTLTDADGCSSTATTSVSSTTVLTLSAGASLPLANVGVVVSLTASAEVAAYQWSAPTSALLTTPATSSAVSVSLTTAGVQTFTVVATAGVCSQSALVSVTALAGPDLSAIMSLPEANFQAGDAKGLLVQLQEVNGAATSAGAIVLTLTVPTGYSVSFDNTLTSISVAGGSGNPVSVDNSKWHITTTIANQQISLTINAGEFIAARGVMNLGFMISRTSANSGSTSNITVNVADDSGGTYDVNKSNNVYARIISGL